jgi:hypothetical protein
MFSKQTFLRAFLLVALATSATVAAKADPLDFTLTGQGTDITFTLNSSPTVSSYSNTHGDFVLDNVVLDVNGHHDTTDLTFFKSAFGGGLEAGSGYTELFNLFGAQLFTGLLSNPTFTTGNFTLEPQGNDYAYCNQGSYKLSIVDPTAVTPEPSSMLLLTTGVFALLGVSAVKRYAA